VRLLHTSDWHVGKAMRGRSRADEHRAVLDEIARITEERSIEIVLIAGDLFETSAPSAESEQIVYRALLELSRRAEHVVVIAGNHDNARRLAAIRPLLDLTNIHTRPLLRPAEDGGLVELTTAAGERARIAVLPFVSQRAIVRADALMADDADDHAQTYEERLKKVIDNLCAETSHDAINILLAHATVDLALPGGGERMSQVNDYAVKATCFPAGYHYTALGHLHQAQQIPGPGQIWYSGSPLQLDFGETENRPSINVIEARAGAPASVEPIPLRSGRPLRRLRATLADLEAQAAAALPEGEEFLLVELTAPRMPGLAERVRELLPNAVDVRIDAPDDDGPARRAAPRIGRSETELFAEYLTERNEDDERVRQMFGELLEDARATD